MTNERDPLEELVDSDPELCRLRIEHDALAERLERMIPPRAWELALEMEHTTARIVEEVGALTGRRG